MKKVTSNLSSAFRLLAAAAVFSLSFPLVYAACDCSGEANDPGQVNENLDCGEPVEIIDEAFTYTVCDRSACNKTVYPDGLVCDTANDPHGTCSPNTKVITNGGETWNGSCRYTGNAVCECFLSDTPSSHWDHTVNDAHCGNSD